MSFPLALVAGFALLCYKSLPRNWTISVRPRSPPAVPVPPPSILHLLATNDAPDDTEISRIEEYILTLEAHLIDWETTHIDSLSPESYRTIQVYDWEVQDLNRRIRRVGSQDSFVLWHKDEFSIDKKPRHIAMLIRERDVLRKSIANCRNILAPIRRLPVELISKILRLVRAQSTEESSPWILAHINSQWRACAIQDASLWSKIVIGTDYYRQNFKQNFPVQILMLQLKLSRCTPLHIHFKWGCIGKTDARHFWVLFNTVVPHCSRWEHLTLDGPFDPLTTNPLTSLHLLRPHFPLLHRLEFYADETWLHYPAPLLNIDCFLDAPNLREVLLLRPGVAYVDIFHSPSALLSIPWEQITRYRAAVPAQVHLEILRRTKTLRECQLMVPTPSVQSPSTPILLAALHRLHVDDPTLLDFITAPALRELFISHSLTPVLSFLYRSDTPQLTSLTILRGHSFPKFAEILRLCPTLRHLCISLSIDIARTDSCVLALLTSLRDPELCPELVSFCWNDISSSVDSTTFDAYASALCSFVASRTTGTLRSVLLYFDHEYEYDPRIDELTEWEHDKLFVRVVHMRSSRASEAGPLFWEVVNAP
ncbi:hypothetical protein R3P38DRAFT_2672117 [Favolaschia claudopus]|uniref:F-box domain-containing protein n=1 Tax=Favolaschia claudopus TaxID=2862362 RepID=A0AAV9Z191_9AGAR